MNRPEQCITVEVNDGPINLQARWRDGGAGVLVAAPPHPLYGGSLDHPVVEALLRWAQAIDYASLRFNWRGVGDSGGEPSGDLGAAQRDYGAALDLACQRARGPVIASGYSFGAITALRTALADARVSSLILVAPPAGMLSPLPLAAFKGRIAVLVGDQDAYAPRAELQRALQSAPLSSLDVLDGADHFFSTGLADLHARLAALTRQ